MDALNDGLNHRLLQKTRGVWEPRVGQDLSRDGAKQIVSNITAFFSILAEWKQAEAGSVYDRRGNTAPGSNGRCDES